MDDSSKFLPFYTLFDKLRCQLGIQLGLDQYQLFLVAFSQKDWQLDNLPDEETKKELLNLIKTLWLTEKKHEAFLEEAYKIELNTLKDSLFTPIVERPEPPPTGDASVEDTSKKKTLPPGPAPEPPKLPKNVIDRKKRLPKKKAKKKREVSSLATLNLNFSNDSPVKSSAASTSKSNETKRKTGRHPFILSDKYYPIEERKLKQYWRFLRVWSEKRTTDRIDIKETVKEKAKLTYLSGIKYIKEHVFRRDVFFLVDQGGSMVAFESLAALLVNTFRQSIRSRQVKTYFFHDFPDKSFYFKERSTYIPLGRFLQDVRRDSIVFIISDAGAARGDEDGTRIEQTMGFINTMREKTKNAIWFNPVPQARWIGSSAFFISLGLPMIEITEQGFDRFPDLIKKFE